MRLTYYAKTDALCVDLANRESADSRGVAPGVVLDIDAEGHLIGVDIDQASQIVDLSRLEADSLPISSVSLKSP